jgi:cytochrome P450
MSSLVHAHELDGDEPLTMGELQNLMYQFITGGFETVTTGLTHAMGLLLRYPDQMDLLRADRSLMKGFVEEALRMESPVQGQARVATCDTEIGGVKIAKGTTVIARFGAANHDRDEFAEPERFDIRRANSSNHLAFGSGVHFCIGAPLARAELTTAFSVLLDRLGDITLAKSYDELETLPTLWYLPLRELPITFTKAG